MEPGDAAPSLLRVDQRLFRQSQFWILAGLVSIGIAISSMSKRFKNMEELNESMRSRNELQAEVLRLQQQASTLDRELSRLHHVIQNTTAWRFSSVRTGLQSLVDRSCTAAGLEKNGASAALASAAASGSVGSSAAAGAGSPQH